MSGRSAASPDGDTGLWANTSIRIRVLGGFLALILIAAVIIVIATSSIGSLLAGQRDVSGRAVPYTTALWEASLAAKGAANDERGFLLTGEQEFATEAVGRREDQRAAFDQAKAAGDAAQDAVVEGISAKLEAYNAALDAEFALYGTDPQAARAVALGANRDLRKTYETAFGDALTAASEHVADVAAEQEDRARSSRAMLIALLGLLIASGVALAWALARGVTGPITAQLTVLEAAARRNLTGQVVPRGAPEFRRMARATNDMLEATRQAVATIAVRAQTLSETAAHLAGSSRGIAGSTGDAAQQAEQASATAEQVSAGVQAVSSAAEEMGATISEIASSATNASQVAAEAVSVADAAKGTVAKLDESSAEIDVVVKTITSIAEQTNLLALNATIEAARAGESGRGFAVVAGEVKELAQETARATGDIANRIGAIQEDTGHAIEAISRISAVIAQINEHQTSIASTVEEQSATTREMSRSITDTAAGSAGIADNIRSVARSVTSTTTETQQANAAADSLAAMGAELRQLVGEFTY